MTTMLSLILAFMLTMGGSPAVSVSPVNSIVPESGVSHDITGKPRLGEFLKIYPVGANPNAGNPRLVLNLSFQYKKSPLIDLYQAFNQNPVNFTDPMGLIANPKINPLAAQSAYMQFRYYYGSHKKAMEMMYHYKYSIRSGADNTISTNDALYENALAQSYYYDALDTTPEQFAKDALAGTINAGFELMSIGFKFMSMGHPEACKKIDKIKTSIQTGVNKVLGARKNSIGYMAGTFYGPAVAGGISSASTKLSPTVPAGFSKTGFHQFRKLISELSKKYNLPAGELAVHGSRAFGTSKIASDVDVILRLNDEAFENFANILLSRARKGTALYKKLLKAIEKGKISRFNIGQGFSKDLYLKVEKAYGEVDFSVIRIGSEYDKGWFITIEK